jgi:hypothetical protein
MRWLLVAFASLALGCSAQQPATWNSATELDRLRSAGLARRAAASRVDRLMRGPGDHAALAQAVITLEDLYRREQRLIAAFLTRSLNQERLPAETPAALDLYRENAVELARYRLKHGGDRPEVLTILQQVESYYRRLGLREPADLTDTMTAVKTAIGELPTPTS